MRIALAGISTESCTFSPLPTRAQDFMLLRGDDYFKRYPFLKDFDATFVPLLFARAMPGARSRPKRTPRSNPNSSSASPLPDRSTACTSNCTER